MARSRDGRWRIWYDDQCEICQAGLAWLRWLDGAGGVEAIAISDAGAPPAGVAEEDLLRHLHAEAPDGTVMTGARALAALARTLPRVAWIGRLAERPGLRWLADRLYGWLARHRYALSRCRGGRCRAARVDLVRERGSWWSFQACRTLGWGIVAVLALRLFAGRLGRQAVVWWRARGRSAVLLDGRLTVHFLHGGASGTVPLLFGELFTMIRYRSLLVDPGGTRMRRAVARHLRRGGEPIRVVAVTHAHEEHCGNLEMACRLTGAYAVASRRALAALRQPARIPAMRRLVIGQPEPVQLPVGAAGDTITLGGGPEDIVHVLETPGHTDEHVSYYVPRDRLLLAGDAFMGTHFSTPNGDVDHLAWIASIERLLTLDIEILVEAHGHVHTRRADVVADLERQGLGFLASRREPGAVLAEKLAFLHWVRDQIALGRAEGLPAGAIRATVFPWTQRWSYASVLQDALARAVSGGGFGRHRVVRSFGPPAAPGDPLPTVYELRWFPPSIVHADGLSGTPQLARRRDTTVVGGPAG